MSKSKRVKAISTFLLATIILTSNMSIAMAKDDTSGKLTNTYKKIDLSEVTGEIVAPPLLTSAASAIAKEKEWYEYVYYSDRPVGRYYINDNSRISFFDPYDYSDALIMEVDDSLTEWSSNNSMQISYSTGNSITDTNGKSSDSSTSVQVAMGNDTSSSTSTESVVTTTVEGNVNTYNYGINGETTQSQKKLSKSQLWDPSTFNEGTVTVVEKVGLTDAGIESTQSFKWQGDTVTTQGTVASYDNKDWNTHSAGYTEDNTTTTSKSSGGDTTVISTIADRMSKATGMSTSSSISLSTNNSTTVSKTYNAGYFNDKGAPLQWKIIKYTVKMPMKYQIEYLVDGEWIYGDSSYCTLNTIQGTCRAYMSNNVAYYEHWGTGEPVVWEQFWGQFFTESSLIAAYKNRLYPDN